jgi:DNA repair protein RadD
MSSGRLDEGEGALFGAVAYEIGIGELIERGWLCPPIPKRTETHFDVGGVHTRGGDFVASELAAACDLESVTQAAVEEIVGWGQDRRSWLTFGTSIQHALHIRDALRARRITAETVTGKTPRAERDALIREYKAGRIRCLSTVDVLTTGFDAPATDLLAVLRPTKSAGLWVQICGRGTRLSPETGKKDCLVLDFGENARRFGPIDQITGRKAATKGGGAAPVKSCPECWTEVPAGAARCFNCGFEFPPPQPDIQRQASDAAILSTQVKPAEPDWIYVNAVDYSRHFKEGRPDSLLITYWRGVKGYKKFLGLSHSGKFREEACAWWRKLSTCSDRLPPRNTDEGLRRVGELRQPTRIAVKPDGKFVNVVGAVFD